MNENTRQAIELVTTHPKVSVALVAASQANIRWMDYAEPYIKDITNVLGGIVLALLVVKHVIDIKNSLSNKDS